MRIKDLFSFSLRNLWRRKLRTFLTILGVVIGAASIVIMLSLGIAMNENFMEQIGQMGSLNTITVYRSYNYDPNVKAGDQIIIDDKAILAFENLPGVAIASPIVELQMKMSAGDYLAYLSIRGIKPEILKAQSITMTEGRLLEAEDENAFIFGGGVKYNLYNPKDTNYNGWGMYGEDYESPVDYMNEKVRISYDMSFGDRRQPGQMEGKKVKPITIDVVGVMKEGSGEHDYYTYTTLEHAKFLQKEQKKYEEAQNPDPSPARPGRKVDEGYNSALVQVADMNDVKRVLDDIKGMGYEAYSLIEYLESMQKTAAGIQAVLGGIGAVSLLVAALGITNTMIMSIYERTKEIGVMKVIGASLKDIKRMFLAEAAMIGFFGGVLGLFFSFAGSLILNYVGRNFNMFGGMGGESKISIIPIWLYALSLTFTTLVGIVSGYLPAIKAMKLSVLKALRTE